MVNDRTIITELSFCLGLLDHDDFHTMPQIDGMDESHWHQLLGILPNPKYEEIYNLSRKQGRLFGKNLIRIESINWVANAHSRYGKQIDIVVFELIELCVWSNSWLVLACGSAALKRKYSHSLQHGAAAFAFCIALPTSSKSK